MKKHAQNTMMNYLRGDQNLEYERNDLSAERLFSVGEYFFRFWRRFMVGERDEYSLCIIENRTLWFMVEIIECNEPENHIDSLSFYDFPKCLRKILLDTNKSDKMYLRPCLFRIPINFKKNNVSR